MALRKLFRPGLLVLCFALIGAYSHCFGAEPCFSAECIKARDAATATPAATGENLSSLLDKLIRVDAPAAIARAQKVIDANKDPAQVIYAQKRIECYQTIVAIAPNFALLSIGSSGEPAGVLDKFEILAEKAEGLATVEVGLPALDRARFDTACGWIGQRTVAIAGGLGLRVVGLRTGLGVLLPR